MRRPPVNDRNVGLPIPDVLQRLAQGLMLGVFEALRQAERVRGRLADGPGSIGPETVRPVWVGQMAAGASLQALDEVRQGAVAMSSPVWFGSRTASAG